MKKLCFMALITCAIASFCLYHFFEKPILNSVEGSLSLGLKILIDSEKPQQIYSHANEPPTVSNLSNSRSNVLEIIGDIRIHGESSTVFLPSNSVQEDEGRHTRTLRPYARKFDLFVMSRVKEWEIKYAVPTKLPDCLVDASAVPAILFSTRGYAGNQFHEFTDLLIPLYLTSRRFDGKVVLLVTDYRRSWISKYRHILDNLSDYDVIDVDHVKQVTCFRRLILGLKAHKELGMNPEEPPFYSMREFRQFLRATYSLPRDSLANRVGTGRPRLLIISRKKSRRLTNEHRVAAVAASLGFDVALEGINSNLSAVARLVNSFDVIMGVHGAGLSNMVFLPYDAVVIEIVPFGLVSFTRHIFPKPAKEMGLRYLEYKVGLNESSLLGRYPVDSVVYTNPRKIEERGFLKFKDVYMDNQDINLDCVRVRDTLLEALRIIG